MPGPGDNIRPDFPGIFGGLFGGGNQLGQSRAREIIYAAHGKGGPAGQEPDLGTRSQVPPPLPRTGSVPLEMETDPGLPTGYLGVEHEPI